MKYVCYSVMSYEDGMIKCIIHDDASDHEVDPTEDEVPWLCCKLIR